MPKYAVTAQAFNRHTGATCGPARTEVVTSCNRLFSSCTNIMEVREAYESFWNCLNPCSEQVVFVSHVVPQK